MATVKTRIELNEKDLLHIIAEKYKLKREGATIVIYKYDGDSREPAYTSIIVEGIQDN